MMRKNILIFCHHYAVNFLRVCNQYVYLFDPKKYHVTVVYLVGEPDEIARKQTLAEEVIFFNESRKNVRGLKLGVMKRIYQFCRERQFEMVICHRWKAGYLLLWVSLFISIPKIFIVMHALGTFKNFSRRLLFSLLKRQNVHLAGVSNAVRDDLRHCLRHFVAPQKIITLYNSVNTIEIEKSFFPRATARDRLQLPQNSFVFATLGRLHWMKDQQTLLRGFARIHQQCSDAILILLGDGDEEARLKQLAKELGIQNKVIFAGFVSEGHRYARAFDVFLLTSVQEGFGFVLPEVMLAKVPAIGTRAGGIPEIIGDTGIIVSPKDDQALADAMLKFYRMSIEERAVFGEKAYQRIITQFSWPRFYEYFWHKVE